MNRLSIVTPCYNEEDNVDEVYRRVRGTIEGLAGYSYEHIFIDNASTDDTVVRLKVIAASDPRVRIIVNTRNFGHLRSPYHAMLQARGDAVVSLVSDLQDPPELIPDLVRARERGAKVVVAVKVQSEEHGLRFRLRTLGYRILRRLSDIDLVENFTGFGLYDRGVMESTIAGFGCAAVSLLFGFAYFVYKLLFWNSFTVGIARLVFLGIIGEFVGAVHTQVRKRPLMVEKERVNF